MCLNQREKGRASSVWVCGCARRAQRSCRMTAGELKARLAAIVSQELPLPGGGRTSERLRLIAETAREDLSLAKLAEAHWDAVAILAEAGRAPEPGMLYAVWASEIPGQALRLKRTSEGYQLSGSKPFCSGIGNGGSRAGYRGPSGTAARRGGSAKEPRRVSMLIWRRGRWTPFAPRRRAQSRF